MSKRLQVRIPDHEMSDIQRFAERKRLTVGEWVRRTLRKACMSQPVIEPEAKLRAIRHAIQYSFPTAHIEPMTAEIDRGDAG
jgi:hypothetical protein